MRFALYRLSDAEPRSPLKQSEIIDACISFAQEEANASQTLPLHHRKLNWYSDDSGSTWLASVWNEKEPRYQIVDALYGERKPKA
jgi:hypothetical protein